MRDYDKFKGCLIGGAVGDALGYQVEFDNLEKILSKYGENGITYYDGEALISDDTQMTLFTAVGLLNGTSKMMNSSVQAPFEDFIRLAYLDWLQTQIGIKSELRFTWLLNVDELNVRREPGNTNLSALVQGGKGTLNRPINNSKGNGALMRVAPIGLYFNNYRFEDRLIVELGARVAALTHGHELSSISSAMMVQIISCIAGKNMSIEAAVDNALDFVTEMFKTSPYMNEFIVLMEKAIILSKENVKDTEAIESLGQGWVAEEALAISIYSALKYHDDFEKAIIAAVNHSGDSDSTGSITGNIVGASLGYTKIPNKFVDRLECHDLIVDVATDLYEDCQISDEEEHDNDLWVSKYLEFTYQPK